LCDSGISCHLSSLVYLSLVYVIVGSILILLTIGKIKDDKNNTKFRSASPWDVNIHSGNRSSWARWTQPKYLHPLSLRSLLVSVLSYRCVIDDCSNPLLFLWALYFISGILQLFKVNKFRSDHYPLGHLKNPANRISVGKPHGKRLLIRWEGDGRSISVGCMGARVWGCGWNWLRIV